MSGSTAEGLPSLAALAGILAQADRLAGALGDWAGRDDSTAQPAVRRAANEAVDAIDTLSRDLFALRQRLLDEIRASDDAAGARADALLRRIREARGDAQ